MLRKSALLVLFLLALLSAPVLALDDLNSGAIGMARYFPTGTDIFFAMRIDDAYVGELDAVIDKVIRQLPREFRVPPFSLADELQNVTIPNMSYAELRAMLGDHVAFAAGNSSVLFDDTSRNDESAPFMVAVEIRDRAAVENFVASTNSRLERRSESDYTIFEDVNNDTYFTISNSLLYITSVSMLPPTSATLLDDSQFVATMQALPAPSYNIAFYIDARPLMNTALLQMGSNPPRAMQEMFLQFGSIAFGLTILDSNTLTMDWVQKTPSFMRYEPIDPAFVRFASAGTSAVIHASGLSDQINYLLEIVRDAARQMDQRDPMLDVRAGFAMLGLDVEEDILSWMNGDYLATLELNLDAIVNAILANDPGMLSPLPLEFSLIFEATDAAKAANLVQKLTTTLQNFLTGQNEVSIVPRQIANGTLTEIKLAIPLDSQFSLTYIISLGATDEVFFIASEGVASHILNGGPGIDSDAAYQEAARYFLPDAVSLAYADGEGLLSSAAVVSVPFLVLMGPSIGNVFEDVIEGLNSLPAPTRQAVQNTDDLQMFRLVLDALNRIVSSSSITSSIVGDFMVARAVITLGE